MQCTMHGDRGATYYCGGCHGSWCGGCALAPSASARVRLCPQCRGFLDTASSARLVRGAGERSFTGDLFQALTYPFEEGRWVATLGGGLLLWLVSYVGQLGGLLFVVFTLALGLMVSGYLTLYMLQIMNNSANGYDDLPPWPDLHDGWGGAIWAYLRVLFLMMLYLVPAGVVMYLTRDPKMAGVALAVSLPFFPISVLGLALHGSILAAGPVRVISAVAAAPLRYLAVLGLGAVMMLLVLGVELLTMEVAVVGAACTFLVSLYFSMVMARALGLFYFHNARQLGWFGER